MGHPTISPSTSCMDSIWYCPHFTQIVAQMALELLDTGYMGSLKWATFELSVQNLMGLLCANSRGTHMFAHMIP